jgi:hypothetical protein
MAIGVALALPAVASSQDTTHSKTAGGEVVASDTASIQWTGPLGYRLRPGAAPIYCTGTDVGAAQAVRIDTSLYSAGMITPEQAKAVALCAVPGQIGSGEMEMSGNRPIYDITLIPTDKKTYTKIQIDAYNGEVVNSKQFGGLRGLAGFLRESFEHKENKKP